MAAPTNAANVKKALANSEPSTHGPKRTFRDGGESPLSEVKRWLTAIAYYASRRFAARKSVIV
jgi:hypothetical protein